MSKPFHNPFERLADLTGVQPSQSDPIETREAPVPSTPGPRPIPRAVVRIERSGRGGKEVTIVEHLDLPAPDRDVWLKALKAALGCGGTVEGSSLVLQGDQRKRLPAILANRGVKKVTVG